MRLASPANYAVRGARFRATRRCATRTRRPATDTRTDRHITTRPTVIPVVCGRLRSAFTFLSVNNRVAAIHAAPDMLFRAALRQGSRGHNYQK